MSHRDPFRWSALTLLVLATAIGCAPLQPATFTEAQAQAVRDTVTVLENALNMAVDALDCDSGMAHVGNQEPAFVGNGMVIRTAVAMREMCGGMVAQRTGAVFVIDTLNAHALSPESAYVVREGDYTINLLDGSSTTLRLVMTTVWARQDGEWKMVHLHESWPQ